MTKSRVYRYDYYTIYMPSEAFDSDERLCQAAIDEAKEKAKLYCMPATWTANILVRGYETKVKVSRKRYNTNVQGAYWQKELIDDAKRQKTEAIKRMRNT